MKILINYCSKRVKWLIKQSILGWYFYSLIYYTEINSNFKLQSVFWCGTLTYFNNLSHCNSKLAGFGDSDLNIGFSAITVFPVFGLIQRISVYQEA